MKSYGLAVVAGTLAIEGNSTSTLSGSFTGSFSGSAVDAFYASGAFSGSFEGLIDSASHTAGTASFSNRATSASIADDLKTGLTISASAINVSGDLSVEGTASFNYLQSITGSAKTIGDAFIILNNDTPASRYAGLIVQDSGSTDNTASIQFDGQSNDWFYQYTDDGGATQDHASILFGPAYPTIGSPVFPTSESVLVSEGGHHVTSSILYASNNLVSVHGAVSASSTGEFSSLGINTAPSGVAGAILATNDVVAFASSDERLKTNLEPIGSAVEKIEQLTGYTFNWIPMEDVHVYGDMKDIGVVAQEVEKVLPEIVSDRENGYKAVKYDKLTAVLIQAVKELSERVKTLEGYHS